MALECHACMSLYLYKFCSARQGAMAVFVEPLTTTTHILHLQIAVYLNSEFIYHRDRSRERKTDEKLRFILKYSSHDYRGTDVLRSVCGSLQTQEPEHRALA